MSRRAVTGQAQYSVSVTSELVLLGDSGSTNRQCPSEIFDCERGRRLRICPRALIHREKIRRHRMRAKVMLRAFQQAILVGVLALTLALNGCVELLDVAQPHQTGAEQPDEAFVSPDMKFEEITSVGIFPFLPLGDENDQLADLLNSSFGGEVQNRQGSAWRIRSHRQVLDYISQGGLGQGYKQLQADHNTSMSGILLLLRPACPS